MKTKLIQLFLLVIAGCSFYFCFEIGNKYKTDSGGTFEKFGDIESDMVPSGASSTSGFNGGALGMGIICASSLLGIVFLETKK
tara:strand:- start:813 stop:1061 length:249 start_codon:yes stop_codon:yes gene_type:complete